MWIFFSRNFFFIFDADVSIDAIKLDVTDIDENIPAAICQVF